MIVARSSAAIWHLSLLPSFIMLCMSGTVTADEPKWESLISAIEPESHLVVGKWTRKGETLSVAAENGARMALPVVPSGEYDLRASFTRKSGEHSVGVIVVHGGRQVAVEVDAWGMNLSGIQDLGGRDIRNNPTRRAGMRLENGRRYTLVVEVRKDRLRAILDDREFAKHATDGSDLSLSDLWAMPDITLKNVKASDYDAILFSGGWGSSMYQYAFEGRYSNSSYNGDRATKAEVNRVINEFIQQDKYVCALCNAVSVLAWARVDGKSPLAGKRVCAPTRQAAAGIYNGRSAQPSCRWHPEQNGAIMSPAGAIGQPNSSHDDVLVDGRIITGEDDPSAREMGRRIVEVLSKQ